MTAIQKLFLKVLPRKWADDMRKESEGWKIRCEAYGYSRSIWEAGHPVESRFRWQKVRVFCKQCGEMRTGAVEYQPAGQ